MTDAIRWSSNPRRSLIIFAAGAVIGLVIAGFGLFTAKGTAVRAVPPEDVALVNQKPILLSDFNAQLQAQYAVPPAQITAAERRATLKDMIREELFVQRGLELDMPASDPDTRSALVAAVEQQVLADVTARQLSEAELRAYYETHKDRYSSEGTLSVLDFRTPDGDAARARTDADSLRRGTSPASLGLKDSGKVSGEEFYFAAKIHLGDALFSVARGLKDGQVSDPVATAYGVHILMVTRNLPPVPQSFDEAAARVRLDYDKDLRAKMTAGELTYLKSKADILIAPAYR